ncbi:hypothetical protein KUV50_07725 [Membranicola marinus]|uniref:Uncharacterized protein n=1 Tax=Membranihabitans marinus TaxID=1227546 RepID=A0A953HNT9_9BACT|nr:hypothetical protein [Membranihabitans marinus]MBY5958013.1 hypothetical protein [Membranihabitans marinus]
MGVQLLLNKDDPWKLPANQLDKISRILTSLDTIYTLEPFRQIPRYRYHALKGDLQDDHSVS